VIAVGTKVRVDPLDDDWPGRVGRVISPVSNRFNNVYFEDNGEGGEYPDEALEILDDE
jgi:hypothetical protein